MNICFIANANSVHTRRWVKFFIDRGHNVSIITHSFKEMEGAKIYHLASLVKEDIQNPFLIKIFKFIFGPVHASKFFTFSLNFPLGLIQTSFYIKKIKPDVIHAHFVTNHGFYAAVSRFHPFVLTPWGTDVLVIPKKSSMGKRLTRFVLKKADMITTDGDNTVQAMLDLGAEKDKIRKIYFGIDTKKFSPDKRSPEVRKKMGLNGPSVGIISFRALDPLYNVELLIRSAPFVIKQCPEARFIIVGKGSQGVYLKELAESLKVPEYMSFITFLSDEDFPQYIASADIYVSTALSDSGLAASTGEAMASGLPVLITETGASKDWVDDDRNGYIIPKHDPEFLADKICSLVKDKTKREAFGKANCLLIRERQDYYVEMGKMEEIYQQLVDKCI
ncbi:MAG: glycosyltransferase family 4 protein [bacterium]|nr:glycosyltransferase family 4 protein [bacterium]